MGVNVLQSRAWCDFERTSVLNLDGSDAEACPYAVPRLVVARDDDGGWRAFAVTSTQPIVEFGRRLEGRAAAKRALVTSILVSLHEDAARPGHSDLLVAEPFLEEIAVV